MVNKVSVSRLLPLILVCIVFGAGFTSTMWAIYMEATEGLPIYTIMAGIGALIMSIGTFLAILQQKVEKLQEQ